MAQAAASALALVPASGTVQALDEWGQPLDGPMGQPLVIDLAARKQARIQFCATFANTMATLEQLARKELARQRFTGDENDFLRGLMNRQDHDYLGPTFDGWYPELFYKDYGQLTGNENLHGSNQPDPLVTDLFTAPPDEVDPAGGVLHEATGNVDLLLIAVDNGPDRMVYAGPTLSHYEFLLPGPTLRRLTDEQWKEHHPWPPRPDWTQSYLVPVPAP